MPRGNRLKSESNFPPVRMRPEKWNSSPGEQGNLGQKPVINAPTRGLASPAGYWLKCQGVMTAAHSSPRA